MELNEQIIAELRALVEKIAQGQPTPAKKFFYEMLFGMVASGSVLLTEVGRKLPPTGTLHAIEKRLSRQLGSGRWDADALLERYVAWGALMLWFCALRLAGGCLLFGGRRGCLRRVADLMDE